MKLSFSTKALSALAGAAFLAASLSAPASAFTLSSPSMGDAFSTGQVDKVWWCYHCGYHPWHHYWGPGYGYWPHRHCWWSPWGWRCRWW
jgi:hypothetical protein